jgi:hypothetical protein
VFRCWPLSPCAQLSRIMAGLRVESVLQTTSVPLYSANGGLNRLYQIGGPRSTQLALKLLFRDKLFSRKGAKAAREGLSGAPGGFSAILFALHKLIWRALIPELWGRL